MFESIYKTVHNLPGQNQTANLTDKPGHRQASSNVRAARNRPSGAFFAPFQDTQIP